MMFEWEQRDLEAGRGWWEDSDEPFYVESLEIIRIVCFRLQYCGLKYEVEKRTAGVSSHSNSSLRGDFICPHKEIQARFEGREESRTISVGSSPG
jgi:hypothetical protein